MGTKWIESKDAAKHLKKCTRQPPTTNTYLIQNINCAKDGKPYSRATNSPMKWSLAGITVSTIGIGINQDYLSDRYSILLTHLNPPIDSWSKSHNHQLEGYPGGSESALVENIVVPSSFRLMAPRSSSETVLFLYCKHKMGDISVISSLPWNSWAWAPKFTSLPHLKDTVEPEWA